MRFREFIAREDANSSEKGLLTHVPDERPPSKGWPFGDKLGSFAKAKGGGGGGAPQGGMMMNKKMKKKMKKL